MKEREKQEQVAKGWTPAVGEVVELPTLGCTGVVTRVRGKNVTVTSGMMTLTLKMGDVTRAV